MDYIRSIAINNSRGFGHGFRSPSAKDEWLTPLAILRSLGPFDLDPCAPLNRPWPTAAHHLTIEDDGLAHNWFGRVWLNPPYSKTNQWLGRLADHGNGIALIFARTETRWFFRHVWQRASAVFFFKGRIAFHHTSGKVGASAGAPSCLVAYGRLNVQRIRRSGLIGKLIVLRSNNSDRINLSHRVKLPAASSGINT
ncbi:MAG: DNA N-6-adenine-methyltransferase [Blastocatellia bacterium]